MLRRIAAIAVLTAVAIAVAVLRAGSASPANPLDPPSAGAVQRQLGPIVRPTQFSGDVRNIPRGNIVVKGERPEPLSPSEAPPTGGGDPALQTGGALTPAPAPSKSFPGLDFQHWGAGWPPDTNGDVGPDHYIQTVNTSIGIFDKLSGTRLAAFSFNGFFSQAPTGTPCDNQNQGDPVALYDSIGDRWIVTDFAWSNFTSGAMYQCMAVSKTADPVSGGWWFYAWQTGPGGKLPDYPKLGVWPDGIYMSANMFATTGAQTYQNAQVWAFDRVGMEAGLPAQSVSFILPKTVGGVTVFSLLPSNARAATGLPPAGSPNYFASIYATYQIRVWKFHVDFQTPANSTFTGPTNVPISTFNVGPGTVPMKDGNNVDTLTYRVMMQNQYTNLSGTESLWLTHTVGSGGTPNVGQVRWYQLPVTGGTIAASPAQQSTWGPDSKNRFMPSLAVDKNGDMAVGYSVSDSTMYPAIRYAGRLAGDPPNTLGQSETPLIQGAGFQCCNFSDGSTNQRWGDYSAMSIDPDGCTFWYTNEYYDAHPTTLSGDNWLTRIGSFRLPGCSSAGYHTVGRVTCNSTSPRFRVGAPTVFGYDPADYQFVLWRTVFLRYDGAAWSLDAATPFVFSVATATSAADQWYDLNGNPVATSANLSLTADSSLPFWWLAADQTFWLTSAGALAQSDLQVVLTPSGAAAVPGTPVCYWAAGTMPPPSLKQMARVLPSAPLAIPHKASKATLRHAVRSGKRLLGR
jgi:hypothetical protein